MRLPIICALGFAVLAGGATTTASELSRPLGDPLLERPTLRSLGVYWIIQGGDYQYAFIALEYRKLGSTPWRTGARLFRVERRAHLMEFGESELEVNLFVGTQARYGMDFTARMKDCDFDYDGFAGGPYEILLPGTEFAMELLRSSSSEPPYSSTPSCSTRDRSSRQVPRHSPTLPGRTTRRSTFASRRIREPSMPARSCPAGTMVFEEFVQIWVRMNSATCRHITGRGTPDRNESA